MQSSVAGRQTVRLIADLLREEDERREICWTAGRNESSTDTSEICDNFLICCYNQHPVRCK